MSVTIRKINAKAKDPVTGELKEFGLFGSDALEVIETKKQEAVAAVTEEKDDFLAAIQDKGEEYLESIEDKGETTLASIPNDYTELANEVSDLRDDLKEIEKDIYSADISDGASLDTTKWEQGYWKISDGTAESSSNYIRYTRYANTNISNGGFCIDIPDNFKLRILYYTKTNNSYVYLGAYTDWITGPLIYQENSPVGPYMRFVLGKTITENISPVDAPDIFQHVYIHDYLSRAKILNNETLMPLSGQYIVQGTYDVAGDRIRISGFIPVYTGMRVRFEPGINTAHFLIGIFNNAKTYVSEYGWYTKTKEFEFQMDGYAIFIYRKNSDNSNISPTEYDAITTLIPAWKAYVSDIGSGLSDNAKQALLNCFMHVAWIDEHGQDYYNVLANEFYPSPTSITATFNPGQNKIYDTDALDSLKQYLTVTGMYSDGSTRVINDYSLSGTLAYGTRTITVAKGEISATFNVSVEYLTVEWDYTDGSPIDNGFLVFANQGTAEMIASGYTIISNNVSDNKYILYYPWVNMEAEYTRSIIELTFILEAWGSYNNAPYMNGIQIEPSFGNRGGATIKNPEFILNKSGLTSWHPTQSNQYNHDVLNAYDFVVGNEYILKVDLGTENCKIYINGTLIATEPNESYVEINRQFLWGVRRGSSITVKHYKEQRGVS